MFRLRRKPAQYEEDPAVAPIEELLRAAASRHPAGELKGRTRHSLWICACVSYRDAPTWLIYDTADGIGWRRWSNDVPEPDDIRAPLTAGGHADPDQVLAWLRGQTADPWGGSADGSSDPEVLTELQHWTAESSQDFGHRDKPT